MSDLLTKLAAQEKDFLRSEFFSPVIKGQPVRVRIANVVMTMKVEDRNFQGWGIFTPTSFKTAKLVREAEMEERDAYLNLFPKIRFLLCGRADNEWHGVLSYLDNRFNITSTVPIHLVEEGQLFNAIITRFDGSNFWFEEDDFNYNPETAEVLREHLAKLNEPDKIIETGVTKQELVAYSIALLREIESRKDIKEERIKDALRRGGAEYRSFVERGNTFTVEFVVDGSTHRSVVDRDNLNVQSAGICLTDHHTGEDTSKRFDLQSLVSVIREGGNRGLIYRV